MLFECYAIGMTAVIMFFFGNGFALHEVTRPIGLSEDLDESARGCVRIGIGFLIILLFSAAVRSWILDAR